MPQNRLLLTQQTKISIIFVLFLGWGGGIITDILITLVIKTRRKDGVLVK